MVGRVLSLYVRVGVQAANLALRTTARATEIAISAARAVVPYGGNGTSPDVVDSFQAGTQPVADPQTPPVEEPPPSPAGRSEPEIDYEAEPPTPLQASATAAKTIDDDPELVAEFAEPGAEDGASAEVAVDQPWDGYDDLSADAVVAHIEAADAAELAVIELYERTNKDRRTVLAAAEARLKALNNAPD